MLTDTNSYAETIIQGPEGTKWIRRSKMNTPYRENEDFVAVQVKGQWIVWPKGPGGRIYHDTFYAGDNNTLKEHFDLNMPNRAKEFKKLCELLNINFEEVLFDEI